MLKLSAIIDKLIWLFTLALFCSFYIFESNHYNRFILLSITIVILFFIIFRYSKKLYFFWETFHNSVIVFVFVCLLSYFWSIDKFSSIVQTLIVIQIFICMSVLYLYYSRQKSIDFMLNIIMWGGYLITIYTFKFYGISNIRYLVETTTRMSNEYSNVNTIGLLATFSTIITLWQILFKKFRLYHLFVILDVFLIALSGSRKAFILLLVGVSCVFFFKYFKKNLLIGLIRYILIAFALIFILKLLLNLQLFSVVNTRMETLFNLFTGAGKVDNSAFLRQWMIRIGWQYFLENPLLGFGIGSSGEILSSTMAWRTYFHNNYIELLSGVGLIGTTIYYLMFVFPAIQLFKQRYFEDKNTILCLILIFLLLIKDIGAISYYDKTTYFYIMMFFIQVKINKRNLIGATKENV